MDVQRKGFNTSQTGTFWHTRQTCIHTNRQAGRPAARQAGRQRSNLTGMQADRHAELQADIQLSRHTCRHTSRQTHPWKALVCMADTKTSTPAADLAVQISAQGPSTMEEFEKSSAIWQA